jgi:hypothetical protein
VVSWGTFIKGGGGRLGKSPHYCTFRVLADGIRTGRMQKHDGISF